MRKFMIPTVHLVKWLNLENEEQTDHVAKIVQYIWEEFAL